MGTPFVYLFTAPVYLRNIYVNQV